jgi:Domain of unknown function (DUF5615)
VKLLLDEHYPNAIAVQLRTAGRDAVTVSELGLNGANDEPLLAFAASEERALLTNNVRDFAAIATRWATAGRDHYGLLFTSDQSLPRGRSTIGLYLEVLGRLMDTYPAGDALRNQVRWLNRDTP